MTIKQLVRVALNLQQYQMDPDREALSGIVIGSFPPNGYDVVAKVPPGTADIEQCRIMLRNLLIDRFRLAYHFEKRDSEVLELVPAKNGTKLKNSAVNSDKTAPPETALADVKVTGMDSNACPLWGEGKRGLTMVQTIGQRVCVDATAVPMEEFVNYLRRILGPVIDGTSLKGQYDFRLTYSAPLTMGMEPVSTQFDTGPSLFSALPDQLGLRLEKKKGKLDFLVIDHVEKPSEN